MTGISAGRTTPEPRRRFQPLVAGQAPVSQATASHPSVCQAIGCDGAQGQGLAPGVGAGGDGAEQALEFGSRRCDDAVETRLFVFERTGTIDE